MNEIIKLKVKLLIAEHGRRTLIEALASVDNVEIGDIEKEIEAYKTKKKKPKRQRKGLVELLQNLPTPSEEARQILEKIVYRYDSREFLPQLRDVRKFLDSQDETTPILKSRKDALPIVINVLSHKTVDELQQLSDESVLNSGGDLGIITEQILGGNK